MYYNERLLDTRLHNSFVRYGIVLTQIGRAVKHTLSWADLKPYHTRFFTSLSYQLHDAGFSNLDAIDGSAGMVEEARNSNIYNNVMCGIVGPDRLDMETGEPCPLQ